MPRQLDSLYVFVVENDQGDEGVASYHVPTRRRLPDGTHERIREPMIASSPAKLDELRSIARDIVAQSGQRIKVVRYSQREHVENVVPLPAEDAAGS